MHSSALIFSLTGPALSPPILGVEVLQAMGGDGGRRPLAQGAAGEPALSVVGEGQVDLHGFGAVGEQRLDDGVPGAAAVQGVGDGLQDAALAGAGVADDGD